MSVLAFLAFWEAVVEFGLVNPLFVSSPSRIAAAGYELFASGTIWGDLAASGLEFASATASPSPSACRSAS